MRASPAVRTYRRAVRTGAGRRVCGSLVTGKAGATNLPTLCRRRGPPGDPASTDDLVVRRYQYTITWVPTGTWPVVHSQFIASTLTRTQPCDAGYGGTES